MKAPGEHRSEVLMHRQNFDIGSDRAMDRRFLPGRFPSDSRLQPEPVGHRVLTDHSGPTHLLSGWFHLLFDLFQSVLESLHCLRIDHGADEDSFRKGFPIRESSC